MTAPVTPSDAIREAIAGSLGAEAASRHPDTSWADLRADDLDRLQIAMEVEEALSIEISDAELSTIDTPADLHRLVTEKLETRRAAA